LPELSVARADFPRPEIEINGPATASRFM